jgi:hypothetical protein
VPELTLTLPVLLKPTLLAVLVAPAGPDTFQTPELLIAWPIPLPVKEKSPPEVTLKVPLLLSMAGVVPLLPKKIGLLVSAVL